MTDTPLVFIDFETYYDSDYSLRKMLTAEYILDDRFQIHGMGVSLNGGKVEYIEGPDILHLRAALSKYPIEDSIVVAHNAMFDGAILEWRLKLKPKAYFCTMMAARPIYATTVRNMSLAALTGDFSNAAPKDTLALKSVMGTRFEDMSPMQRTTLSAYGANDVQLLLALYQDVESKIPDSERELIDLTLKKFIRPQLKLDRKLLRARAIKLEHDRAEVIKSAGVPKQVLMSNQKFAAELERRGVKPPMKLSPATQQLTYAFAKSDVEFMALTAPPTKQDVRTLVKARLLAKSTLESTRIARLLGLTGYTRWLPAPTLYYGAHTGRWSGMDGLNIQNLPRGSSLRRAVIAPPGYVVLAGDLSQIEARVLAVLAGCNKLVAQFAAGADVYSNFASKVYGEDITKDTHPTERFVGKTAILGLGYGLGVPKFMDTMRLAGIDMPSNTARRVVYTYRELYREIPLLWAAFEQLIKDALMVPGSLRAFQALTFTHQHIGLPNGMTLQYPNLRWSHRDDKFIFTTARNGITGLYGGKLTENIVQALARIILSNAELRLAKRGVRAALTVHDELVYVVREDRIQQTYDMVVEELTRPVPWMPELPLACEVKYGPSYYDCK